MQITNETLYELCRKYGAQARLWRQKFIGLLPEVNRRRLYEEKGFSSIFEFSAKLCGLSAEQVRLALNLEKRFEDKPVLQALLVNGEASMNKLARIVAIATTENEEELAKKVKVLPTSALNTLVRDEKAAKTKVIPGDALDILALNKNVATENQNGLPKQFFADKGLYVQTPSFELAGDVAQELNELHSKGINVNELLRTMLKQRREEISKAKEKITESIQQTTSRYIPAKIRKVLYEDHGEKCSIATCRKPSKTIHHTQRFSLSRNHDPQFLAPLCRDHHIIAHNIDLKYQQAREFALPAGSTSNNGACYNAYVLALFPALHFPAVSVLWKSNR